MYIPGLLPIWAIAALVFTVPVSALRGKGLLICLPPALFALIYKLPEITAGAKWMIFFITSEYNRLLLAKVPVLFQGVDASFDELALFFAAAGIAIMLPLSIAVCLRRSSAITIISTLPLVLPAFVLKDDPPNTEFLVGLIAIYLILILSGALHPRDHIKRGLAVFPAFLLALILMSATYILAPPNNYQRGEQLGFIERQIRALTMPSPAKNLPDDGWISKISGWRFDTERVDIADAGMRTVTDQGVLEITSSVAGTFYLRGYSMQQFDGRTWHNNTDVPLPQEAQAMSSPGIIASLAKNNFGEDAPLFATMAITKTGDNSDVRYYPYYSRYGADSSIDIVSEDGNQSKLSIMSGYNEEGFTYCKNSPIDLASTIPAIRITGLDRYNLLARERYLQIDEGTADQLRRLAMNAGIYTPVGSPYILSDAHIGANDPSVAVAQSMEANIRRSAIANQVARFVTSSARYSLSFEGVPDDEDFAVYFLQTDMRQGYCIHFATAATLMLRALGIPARFTCGFAVTVSENEVGKAVTVTDRKAHAWVEVYYDNIGWIPLEVSPPSTDPDNPDRSSYGAASDFEVQYTQPPPSQNETRPTVPAPGAAKKEARQNDQPNTARDVMLLFLFVAFCIVLLFLRQSIIRKNRAKGFAQTDTNAAVLCAWRYITRLDRLRNQPQEIEELVLKARFSHHRIPEDERAAMIRFAKAFSDETYRRHNPFGRFFIKFIRGL
jgi:hypothetical protein